MTPGDRRLRAALVALLSPRVAAFEAGFAAARNGLSARRVHGARVAARSLRSVLATLDGALHAGLAAAARAELRELARLLAAPREADVRSQWLLARADRAGLPGRQRERLAAALERDRREARRACRATLAEPATAARLARLGQNLKDPRLVRRRAGLPGLLRQRLRRRWKRLLRTISAAPEEAEALHEVRLRAKHVRYATEALLPLLGADAVEPIVRLRRLQACLGDHQDGADALRWLDAHGDVLDPAAAKALRRLIRRRMRRQVREFRRLGEELEWPAALRPREGSRRVRRRCPPGGRGFGARARRAVGRPAASR